MLFSILNQSVAPNITQSPQSITVRAGTDIILECRATGDPVPLVEWLRNGQSLAPVYAITATPGYGRLLIKYSSTGDSGVYRCRFTNVGGTALSDLCDVKVNGNTVY